MNESQPKFFVQIGEEDKKNKVKKKERKKLMLNKQSSKAQFIQMEKSKEKHILSCRGRKLRLFLMKWLG